MTNKIEVPLKTSKILKNIHLSHGQFISLGNHVIASNFIAFPKVVSIVLSNWISAVFCLGLSLKTQELTAMFLAVRLYCSFFMEGDIHTILDFATLVSTAWVIYMMRFKLKSTYIGELDNMPLYYLVCIYYISTLSNFTFYLYLYNAENMYLFAKTFILMGIASWKSL